MEFGGSVSNAPQVRVIDITNEAFVPRDMTRGPGEEYRPQCSVGSMEKAPTKHGIEIHGSRCVGAMTQLYLNAQIFADNIIEACSGIFTNYTPYVKIVARSALIPPPGNLSAIGGQFIAKFQEEAAKCAFAALVDTLDIGDDARTLLKSGFEAAYAIDEVQETAVDISRVRAVPALPSRSGLRAVPFPNATQAELMARLEKEFEAGVDLIQQGISVYDAAAAVVGRALGGPAHAVDAANEKAKRGLDECKLDEADSALVSGQLKGLRLLEELNSGIFMAQTAYWCRRREIERGGLSVDQAGAQGDQRVRLLNNDARERDLLRERFDTVADALKKSDGRCKRVSLLSKRVESMKEHYLRLKEQVESALRAKECNNHGAHQALQSLDVLENSKCGRHLGTGASIHLTHELQQCAPWDAPVEVEVLVHDSNSGKPVADARVILGSVSASASGGNTGILSVPLGEHVLVVEALGYARHESSADIRNMRMSLLETGDGSTPRYIRKITVVLEQTTVLATVIVQDPHGGPIVGASVSLGVQTLPSGGNGQAVFEVMPGSWNASVHPPSGYQGGDGEVNAVIGVGGSTTVVLNYSPVPLVVRVLGPDGALKGVNLVLEGGTEPQTAVSNDDGTGTFSVAPSNWRVTADKAGFEAQKKQVEVLPGVGGSIEFVLKYSLLPLAVRAYKQSEGKRVPAANITVNALQDGGQLSRRTDGSGATSFFVYPGSVTVSASTEDGQGAEQSVLLSPGDASMLVVLELGERAEPIQLAQETSPTPSLATETPSPTPKPRRDKPSPSPKPPRRLSQRESGDSRPTRGASGDNPLLAMVDQNLGQGREIRRNEENYEDSSVRVIRNDWEDYRNQEEEERRRREEEIRRQRERERREREEEIQRQRERERREREEQIRRQREEEEWRNNQSGNENVRRQNEAVGQVLGGMIERGFENITRVQEERHRQRQREREARERERIRREREARIRAQQTTTSIRPRGRSSSSSCGGDKGCRRRNQSNSARERQQLLKEIETLEKKIKSGKKWLLCLEEGVRRYPNASLDCHGSWIMSSRGREIADTRNAIKKDEKRLREAKARLKRL